MFLFAFSLIISDVEQLFSSLLSIYISSLVYGLLMLSDQF